MRYTPSIYKHSHLGELYFFSLIELFFENIYYIYIYIYRERERERETEREREIR